VSNVKCVRCERRIYGDRPYTHSHPYAQLILPIHGVLNIETSCGKLTVEDEHLFFLPPACSHTFRADMRNEFLVLDVEDIMVSRYDMECMAGGKQLYLDDRWKAIRYLLLNEACGSAHPASVRDLFHYCYRLIADETLPDSIRYINEHFAEDIELSKLADIEHYNINYFCKWFKGLMKVTPFQYIQDLRVKRAKELLADTSYSILQIAEMVGYRHNSSLTRVFKSLENTTPEEFRRKR